MPRGGSRAFQLAGAVLLVLLAGSLVLPQAVGAAEVWRVTGLLVPGCYGHTATLLNDGKVLVAGGGPTQCELYDPSNGTWSTNGAGSLTTGRSNHTATLLPSGKVLVAGGYYIVSLDSAELYTYDPTGGSWTAASSLSTGGRAEHTATLLPSGKVLVTGGHDDSTGVGVFLKSAELFDPASNAGAGAWSPTDSLTTERAEHTATLLPNGKVLVAGGLNSVSGSPNWLTSANLYDPAKATWSATGSLTVERDAHTATLLASGRVLVVGGQNNSGVLTSSEIYNRPDISGVLYLLLLN